MGSVRRLSRGMIRTASRFNGIQPEMKWRSLPLMDAISRDGSPNAGISMPNDSWSDALLKVRIHSILEFGVGVGFDIFWDSSPDNVTITQNIVKTDGQIWMLGYECWTKEDGSPGQVSWSVYSLYRTLPNSLRKELLGYVKDLGFDPVDSREPSYDNCPPILDAYPELRTYPESDKSLLKPSPQVCLPPSNTLPIESWVKWFLISIKINHYQP